MEIQEFPDLGVIPTLKLLSLSGNELTGVRPRWWTQLERLVELDLSKNRFRTLDIARIVANSSLRKLDFKNNEISRIVSPSSSFAMPSLTELRLPRNRIGDAALKNLTAVLSLTPNLTILDLNRNVIRRPQSLIFQNLTKLTELKLRRNQIDHLPDGVFYGLKSLTILRLDDNSNITEVSNGWLFEQHNLKTLSLANNKIAIIKDNAWESTKSLVKLDLRFNQLGCSHSEPSFSALRSLQELSLGHNCLATLDEKTFGRLPKLRILDLSHNHLQWSIEDASGVFSGLSSLLTLNLASNRIETIDASVLRPLTQLSSLDLTGNPLKTLPENPFRAMGHNLELYLNTTQLVCDCGAAWLPGWLATQSFNGVRAACAFPEELNGESVFNLRGANFSCGATPRPVLVQWPQNQTAIYGRNLTLECVVRAGGEHPRVTWTKDRRGVEPFRVLTTAQVEETAPDGVTSLFRVSSRLEISNVSHYDAGLYQCVARNAFGPRYSTPATVIVHRLPYLTKKPADAEVREGDAVELRCDASGFPTPEILLTKIGDFPAPREKRLFYLANIYFIKPVMMHDHGTYVCTATNSAGSVNSTAKVSVIYSPIFTNILVNQEATLGQSIALECQGRGYPKPKVIWYKEETLVTEDRGHVMVDNGQFLLLLKVSRDDIGVYRCVLANALGLQRRNITLTLKQDVILPAVTGLIIMIVVVCVVVTSCLWVIIIYKMKKRGSPRRSLSHPTAGADDGLDGLDSLTTFGNSTAKRTDRKLIASSAAARSPQGVEELRTNMVPLLHSAPSNIGNHHVGNGPLGPLGPLGLEALPGAQDSSSEHSSGKDSGVGDSAQRSSEDLRAPPDGRAASHAPPNPYALAHRRSLVLCPPEPLKGLSSASCEDGRPRLSTFGLHSSHQPPADPPKGLLSQPPPTYASLRRGSTSRLLAVPSPVTPAMNGLGMNSLPRHAFRGHAKLAATDRCSSLSRPRRASRPGTPPPTAVTDRGENFRRPTTFETNLGRDVAPPTYYTFGAGGKSHKHNNYLPAR